MNIFIRKDSGKFGDHRADKRHGRLAAAAQNVLRTAPAGHRLIGPAGAAKLRTACQRRQKVTGHVHLRHNLDLAGPGIGDQINQFVTGIEERTVLFAVGRPYLAFSAGGAGHGQLRIAGNWKPPSLIVGQMQMQTIELVSGHHVDETFQFVDCTEVTGDINHYAAITVSRIIDNLNLWKFNPIRRSVKFAQIGKRSRAAKQPRGVLPGYGDRLR